MKLIIDIPEELYQMCRSCLGDADCIESAIANGTPLQKGHGRLVDEKDLSLMTVHIIDGMFVCDAPTIIEADRAEGSEE